MMRNKKIISDRWQIPAMALGGASPGAVQKANAVFVKNFSEVLAHAQRMLVTKKFADKKELIKIANGIDRLIWTINETYHETGNENYWHQSKKLLALKNILVTRHPFWFFIYQAQPLQPTQLKNIFHELQNIQKTLAGILQWRRPSQPLQLVAFD